MKPYSQFLLTVASASAVLFGLQARAADAVDFTRQIQPLLETRCLSCHGQEKPKAGLRLTTKAMAVQGGDNGTSLVDGKPDKSPLYTSLIAGEDSDALMPPKPKGGPLAKEEIALVKQWIEEGAKWPADVTLSAMKKVDFVKDVKPILEISCVACHKEGHDKGKLRLDTKELAFQGGENGPGIVPGQPEKSKVYTSTTLAADHDDLMPPKTKGGPLPKDQIDTLRDWIKQGAPWPDGMTLVPKKVEEVVTGGIENVIAIHKNILAKLEVKDAKEMKSFTEKIPGSEVTFEMLPIPAGEFLMGSPAKEAKRKDDEGPQHKVAIEPFWMGKCEVTWNEYEIFMFPIEEKKMRATFGVKPELDTVTDAVSRPTTPYVEMSFGMGKDGFPAISMTQHAANKYCEWLSAKTGHFYRLPTEAEWEYACRAGTTTAYSFGDDASQIGEYAWYAKNSDYKYQKVGKKKPNPWGLHDMHGNVLEWTLDQYDATYYRQFEGKLTTEPWNKATKPYPHSARGGSWDDDPNDLRSAARRGSNKTWKIQDPQLPKSIWFHTDAQFLGFRVVRPLKVPSPEELQKYWTSGVAKD